MRILFIEDDEPLRTLLRRGLGEDGHVVDALPDGRECDAYLAATPYDALILDLNLPYEDGLSILRRLRARGGKIPVLILTARDDVQDVVTGLDSGADDYLCKPFAFEELEARLRSLGRRQPEWSSDVLRVGDLRFNCATREAKRGSRALDLTAKEAAFLELLMRNPGHTLTREVLEERLWDRESELGSNVLDVYARRIRVKLTAHGEPQLLHTVRGIGYRLEVPE
jgi:two-component system, OmpR family, copper resistance phosphate regulon response regulator CusR